MFSCFVFGWDRFRFIECNLFINQEVPDYGSLTVPWHLKGFTLHNLVCSLCICPATHKFLKLEERCELSLAGFLLLDLYKVVADRLCQDRGLPKGTLWYAGQTMLNLQATALSTISLCVTKSSGWHPWTVGTSRLSEIAIEQRFGQLRTQSSNAQLSARAFWIACSRHAMKTGKNLNHNKPVKARSQEPHMSDEQPLLCIW